jgi:hypothetical protein
VATGVDAAPADPRRLALGRAARDPLAVPGATGFAVLFVYELKGGGYAATTWYPGALVFLALAVLAVRSHATRGTRLRGTTTAALASLALFTGWSFLSISWADVKGEAWDGSNRTLLYLLVFSFFVLSPWGVDTVVVLLGGFALAVAGLGLAEIVRAAAATEPQSFFQLGRFAQPTNYQNATCALFLMAFWPALLLASRRELPSPIRALATAACAVLAELALLCQSRASLVAFPVTLLVYLVLVPGRARTVVFLIPGAVALAATYRRLLDVFPAIRDNRQVAGAVVGARNVVIVSALACVAAGWLLAELDRRIVPEARLRRAGGVVVAIVSVVAAAAGAGLAAQQLEHPLARAQAAWRSFKVTHPVTGRSYLSTGLGGNRYDLWRVAVHEVGQSPIVGVGADNFAADYLQLRHSLEEPEYPHSLELRVLAQTGAVGGLLFTAFLGAALIGLRRLTRLEGLTRAAAGASAAVVAYWLVHGSVDWFWELPGLGGAAFACLGVAVRLSTASGGSGGRRLPRPAFAAVVAATAVAACTFTLPWLAAAEVARAASSWRADPALAFDRLAAARRLNVLSDMPDLVEGAIASRLGERTRMRDAFRRALGRNPRDWYANFELAVVAALDGRRELALRHVDAARRLDPLEPAISVLAAEIRSRRPISPPGLDKVFLDRIRA